MLHALSDTLTRTYQVITLEDLNVSGMIKNPCLARAISNAGFGELRRQIEYKAAWRECDLCGSVLSVFKDLSRLRENP